MMVSPSDDDEVLSCIKFVVFFIITCIQQAMLCISQNLGKQLL